MSSLAGPVTGGAHGWPFAAAGFNLAALGYAEHEWFLEGAATTYRHTNGTDRTADGRWTAEPSGSEPFRTRLLVHRPTDPERFNGSVVLLWSNVSHGYDYLIGQSAEIYDGGFALVAVSAQRNGVHGYPGGATPGLTVWDPERYGSLHIGSDRASYDIYTQAAAVACSGALGFEPRRVIGLGVSQSATFLATYVNAVQPITSALDAVVLDLYFGNGAALEPAEAGLPDPALIAAAVARMPPGSHRLRDDLDLAVFVLNSETEALLHFPVRQPDTDRYRFWEVAGAAHSSRVRGTDRIPSTWPRDLGTEGGTIPAPADTNVVQLDHVRSSVLRHVQRWLAEGVAPPAQPRIEIDAAAPGGPAIVRDELGIARGGVRLPEIDVPTARHSGLAADGTLSLAGSTTPFDADTAARLVPQGATRIELERAATADAVARGVLRPEDAR